MPHIHEFYDFTASAFIIHPTDKKLCLLKHKKLNKWLQPGGHVELNEDPLQALEHELLEETGLKLNECEILKPVETPKIRGQKNLPVPYMFNVHDFNDNHKHIDLQYIIKSNTDKLSPKEDESQQIMWFTREEINNFLKTDEIFEGTVDICNWIFDNLM